MIWMRSACGFMLGLTLLFAAPADARPEAAEALSIAETVRLALEQSPAVAAARSRLEAASAALRGARAPYDLQAELAPGVGFTNGNALLSQRLDIGGRRSAEARAARGLQTAAAAELDLTRLRVAAEARAAYFDLVRVRAVETAAAGAAELARQVRDAVRRRVEIGEAPAVQATRAEIEVARAEQEVVRAGGEVRSRLAVLNRLLGRLADAPFSPTDTLALPPAPADPQALIAQAVRRRPELAAARGLIEARRGEVEVARSQRRPDLFAELAADTWSLDREPFRLDNLGLQARVSFPLFDRGRLRAEVDRARAGVRAQEAELEAARLTLTAEIDRAAAELTAAREVALNYEQIILPRSQELLDATRRGFEIGLSSFLDVLEAQRVARQTQTEYLNALFDAERARIALDRALGVVPGFTAAPLPADRR
jgi:outer membrane protein, heavy metal efflux system